MHSIIRALWWIIPMGLVVRDVKQYTSDQGKLTIRGNIFSVRIFSLNEGLFIVHAPVVEAKSRVKSLREELRRVESALEEQKEVEENNP